MAIFLPRNWRQQPTVPVEIDFGHPLAQGVVFASLGGQQYDAVLGRPVSWGGTGAYRASNEGMAPRFDISNAQIFPRDALMEPSTAITVVAHAQRIGNPALFSRVLHKHNASISFWLSSYALIQNIDSGFQMNGLIAISGTVRDAGNYTSSASELEKPFSHAVSWATGTSLRQYVNGILRTSGSSISGTISYDSGNLYLGNAAALTSGFAGVVNGALIYNRALSAAEVSDLSLGTGNPWQIYRPYRARVYAFSSGDSGVASGAGSSAGTSTAAGVGASTAAASGASAGAATAPGVGASTAAAAGTSAGSATATAEGAEAGSIQSGAGTSAGSSTAIGVSPGGSIESGAGTAAGSATATGTGASTAAAAGTSAGSATASAVGTDASVTTGPPVAAVVTLTQRAAVVTLTRRSAVCTLSQRTATITLEAA